MDGNFGSADFEKSDGLKRSDRSGGGLAGFGRERGGKGGLSLSELMLIWIGAWWFLMDKGHEWCLKSPVRSPQ